MIVRQSLAQEKTESSESICYSRILQVASAFPNY